MKCKEDENKKYKKKTKSKCEVCNVYLCKECFEEYHRGLKREIKAKRGRKCNVEGERKKAKVFQLIKDDTPMDIDKENSLIFQKSLAKSAKIWYDNGEGGDEPCRQAQ